MEAVRKKALGYKVKEVVDEYVYSEGTPELVRRKVTVKESPPDMTAARLLLERPAERHLDAAELEAEKRRLLAEWEEMKKHGDYTQ